jgi:hypothetical protein
MNKLIAFVSVAVVSCALFAQESVWVDLSKMRGSPVVIVTEPLTNHLDLAYLHGTNILVLYADTLATNGPSKVVADLTYANNSVDGVVKQLREQGDLTNLVKTLVKSGDVCAVVGHQWENIPHMTLEYRTSGEYPSHRMCRLCGKVETKEPREWK